MRVLLPRHSMCHVDDIVIVATTVGVFLRGSAVSSQVAGVRFEQSREVRFGGVIAELRLAREYGRRAAPTGGSGGSHRGRRDCSGSLIPRVPEGWGCGGRAVAATAD